MLADDFPEKGHCGEFWKKRLLVGRGFAQTISHPYGITPLSQKLVAKSFSTQPIFKFKAYLATRTVLGPIKENQIIQAELGAESLVMNTSKLGLREPET